MKVGDLVQLTRVAQEDPTEWLFTTHIVIEVFGSNEKLVCLTGFPSNQVFRASQLEVINEYRNR